MHTHCHKVEAWSGIKHVLAVAAVPAAGWDPSILRMKQLNDQDIGPILEEETGQRPEWKDIATHSPTYKSYWTQLKSIAVRNGILQRHWESADG
jgi:hypothetical protein